MTEEKPLPATRAELLDQVTHMIKTIEELPPQAMGTYLTHYDYLSLLLLLAAVLRDDCKEDS
jgi:hypothetical protein